MPAIFWSGIRRVVGRVAAVPAALALQMGLSVHGVTQYPTQPRPFDLTAADLPRLVHCVVSPKVNGCEAFLLLHAFGTAVIERSSRVHCWPPGPRHVWPALLEGEVLDPSHSEGSLVFVAYDCVCTPVLSYSHHGTHPTRLAALAGVLHAWSPPPGLTLNNGAFRTTPRWSRSRSPGSPWHSTHIGPCVVALAGCRTPGSPVHTAVP